MINSFFLGIHYDYTIRNSLGEVIQYHYGDDGMDAKYQQWITIPYYSIKSIDDFIKQFPKPLKFSSDIIKRQWNRLFQDFQLIQKNKSIWESSKNVTLNIERILEYSFSRTILGIINIIII